jgi:ABC-2 type transport system ATP-binding protein
MTLVVSSHILSELEDYCTEMIVIEGGHIVGGRAIKVKDVERPRYIVELGKARADLTDFLKAAGHDVVEAGESHAVFAFTHNVAARAKLLRDLVTAGFDVVTFAAATKTLEESYYAQVGKQ